MPKKPTVHEFLKHHGIAPVKPGKIIGNRAGGSFGEEKEHFYVCASCGQAVDMRDLGQVFHHEEPGHKPLPTS
jgi:hypothetical protein